MFFKYFFFILSFLFFLPSSVSFVSFPLFYLLFFYLFLSTFSRIWDDEGTGACPADVTFFHPRPIPGFVVGVVGVDVSVVVVLMFILIQVVFCGECGSTGKQQTPIHVLCGFFPSSSFLLFSP